MKFFIVIIWSVCLFSCTAREKSAVEKIPIDMRKIDSIRANSDTSYERIIGAPDFFSAEQYIDKKDSIITKILKDAAQKITAFVQFQRGKRIHFAEYYSNGQLKALLPLDAEGQFHGDAKYYYESGRIKSAGRFVHGLYSGEWKNYTAEGLPESIDNYDTNGQHTGNRKLN